MTVRSRRYLVIAQCVIAGCLLILPSTVHAGGGWNYESNWTEHFQKCAGKRQSPVDIVKSELFLVEFPDMRFKNYDIPIKGAKLTNNGHTIVVTVDTDKGKIPHMYGGGLLGQYDLEQFHFHWGRNGSAGSEHTVDGHRYAGELHLVHRNTKFDNMTAAMKHESGLAVLGIFLEESASGKDQPHYNKIINNIVQVTNAESSADVKLSITMRSLFPTDTSQFYRYEGSLTTPECDEVVTWTILSNPVKLSPLQFEQLRTVLDSHKAPMKNYRPLQQLGARIVYARSNTGVSHLQNAANTQFLLLVSLVPLVFSSKYLHN